MSNIKRKPRPRGFILIETLIGLALAGSAIALTGTAMSQYRTGVRQMLAIQNLKAQANAALLALRAGQAPSAAQDVAFQLVSQEPAPSLRGHVWVQISATGSGQSATLWGLVPQSSLATLQPKDQ